MKMFTVVEAAVALGVSRALVYSLCQQRKIRHERHGLGRGRIVIPEDALEEYRRKQTVLVEEGKTSPPPLQHIILR